MNRYTSNPSILYMTTLLAVRWDRVRSGEKRSIGASAIEWAIITGLLAVIAAVVYGVIRTAVLAAANKAKGETVVPK